MNKPPKECSVEQTSRQVIENVLLARLQDGNTVAILLNEDDLVLLIAALRNYDAPKAAEMARDFSKLLASGFPRK